MKRFGYKLNENGELVDRNGRKLTRNEHYGAAEVLLGWREKYSPRDYRKK
jgi:hypothetical protein